MNINTESHPTNNGPITHRPDTDEPVYFECFSCKAGMHTMINGEKKPTVQKNFFFLKEGDIAPREMGSWISFKSCPDCGKKTVLRTY